MQKSLFSRKGIPIGNLTSQLFANIYLNELDRFIKHGIKAKYYVRYCDDFVILGEKRMIRKVNSKNVSSYLGLLEHCKGYGLEKKISILSGLSEKDPE
jgi:retron-type reverse transcriptase